MPSICVRDFYGFNLMPLLSDMVMILLEICCMLVTMRCNVFRYDIATPPIPLMFLSLCGFSSPFASGSMFDLVRIILYFHSRIHMLVRPGCPVYKQCLFSGASGLCIKSVYFRRVRRSYMLSVAIFSLHSP